MKIKKLFSSLMLVSLTLSPVTVRANESNQEQSSEYSDYLTLLEEYGLTPEDVDRVTTEGFEYAKTAPIVSDANQTTRGISGAWSWRDGLICVTDSYTSFINHGHAGIVAAAPYYDSTIEALNANDGVRAMYGEWSARFNPRVYQCGVTSTTEAQDAAAARLANSWIGKPYSILSTLETTDTFYCSQLVYQAYRLGAGYTLPHALLGIITPADLLHGGATTINYRYE